MESETTIEEPQPLSAGMQSGGPIVGSTMTGMLPSPSGSATQPLGSVRSPASELRQGPQLPRHQGVPAKFKAAWIVAHDLYLASAMAHVGMLTPMHLSTGQGS